MINKTTKFIINIWKNEKVMFLTVIILLILFIISSLYQNEILKQTIEYTTKILFIIWIIWIYELLKEIDKAKKIIVKDLEENNKKVSALADMSENLNKELIKHIWLDLQRDRKFLDIMISLEKTLWEKVNVHNYAECVKQEIEHLNTATNVLKKIQKTKKNNK